MAILVFGKTGQVATELQKQAPVVALGREQADLSDPSACAAAIAHHRPEVVINAAAFTAVDAAETQADQAQVVNGEAPAAMARAASDLGIPFLHISTDYVFDGSGVDAWKPDDATNPLGVYGRSKRAGELGIAGAGGNWAVLRTSWVFSAHGNNFVKTMLRLARERQSLNVVADQVGGPTPAAAIAAALLDMAQVMRQGADKAGIYHFSGAPDINWAGFAREIFVQAGRDVVVNDITTDGFPTVAERPANSRLDCASLQQKFNIARPDWRAGLADVLDNLG